MDDPEPRATQNIWGILVAVALFVVAAVVSFMVGDGSQLW